MLIVQQRKTAAQPPPKENKTTSLNQVLQLIERSERERFNFDDPADVARHDNVVGLVERMLALHQKLAAAAIPADKQLYQRQIEDTDRQIDALVYELYGLTEEEITVVKAGSR